MEGVSAWFLFCFKMGSIAAYLYAERNAPVEREMWVIHDRDHCSQTLEHVRESETQGPSGGLGIAQGGLGICKRKEGRAHMY